VLKFRYCRIKESRIWSLGINMCFLVICIQLVNSENWMCVFIIHCNISEANDKFLILTIYKVL